MDVHIPETLKTLLVALLVVSLVQVTVESWSATIRNSDTNTGTPLISVLLVSIAVTFLLITLVLFAPCTSCVVNRRGLPRPIYSVLLQVRIKLVKSAEPLTVQVKVTSSPRQAWLLPRRVQVNSWHDTQTSTAAAKLYNYCNCNYNVTSAQYIIVCSN